MDLPLFAIPGKTGCESCHPVVATSLLRLSVSTDLGLPRGRKTLQIRLFGLDCLNAALPIAEGGMAGNCHFYV
jgi:gamma-glutamyl phosphate reductase